MSDPYEGLGASFQISPSLITIRRKRRQFAELDGSNLLNMTFEQATAAFRKLADYDFGTDAPASGATQIANATDLALYFQDFRTGEAKPITRNTENQRYAALPAASNLIFTSDAAEITATLPNGSPVGTTSTTTTAPATNSRTISVVDASAIVVGQVVSFGDKQAANLHGTTSYHVRGTPVVGNLVSLTFNFATVLATSAVTVATTADGASTSVSMATDLVAQINASAALQALGIFAFRPQAATGAFCVVYPQLNLEGQPDFGNTTKGALFWGPPTAIIVTTAGAILERKQTVPLCWVTAKSGNDLTLNWPVTILSGDTLNIMPTVVAYRNDPYAGASTVINLDDTSTFSVGQAVQLSFQDSSLRFVVSKTASSITLNAAVGVTEAVPVVSLAAWCAAISLAATATTTLSFTAVPASVRVGQQFQRYQTNPNSNIKVTAINRGASPQTVTLDTAVTFSSGVTMMFFEPIQSFEMWSKTGYCPGADGNTLIALELEADFPDVADLSAWPAFWLLKNASDLTGLPVPSGSSSEIDMTDTFYYWNALSASACYQPQGGSAVNNRYLSPYHDGTRVQGQNLGRQTRKIQLVWSTTAFYAYIDNVLMLARGFVFDNSVRAQISANLAVGATSTGLNSNGFFPIDFSQFPMKYRLKRMRILGQ
jgi:hypothetical protein